MLGMLWILGDDKKTAVMPRDAVESYVNQIGDEYNAYLSPNPTGGQARVNQGRGTEAQVTRVAAVYADLDVKTGACPSIEDAWGLVDSISERLEERPTVVIFSGGGLQPIWTLEACTPEVGIGLLRRFGRLVRAVGQERNMKLDSVFDAARVLRIPGTLNHKYSDPIECSAIPDTGAPMEPDTLAERLDEWGIWEEDNDAQVGLGEVVTPTSEWNWAKESCGYSATTIKGWLAETPTERHPWLLRVLVRLECMRRNGCLTERDYKRAHADLEARFLRLLATGSNPREAKRYEVTELRNVAMDRAQRKAEGADLNSEIGGKKGHACNLVKPKSGETQTAAPGARESPPGGEPGPGNTGRELLLLTADQIKDDIPEWCYEFDGHGRIQRSALTLGAGRPGAGKSTAARWFAAQWTLGLLDGCWKGKPQKVAYIAAEESLEYVVKPGLKAAGADMRRVVFPRVTFDGKEAPLIAEDDEDALVQSFAENKIRIIIVDPIMATIARKVDIYRNNEVRDALNPWIRIAQAASGVVFGIVHLRKGNNSDVVGAVNGSSAFGEVARCVFGFAKDPNSDNGERVMSQIKNSCGVEDLSLSYKIVGKMVETDSGASGAMPLFMLGDKSENSVEDILSGTNTGQGRKAGRPLSEDSQTILRLIYESVAVDSATAAAAIGKPRKAALQILDRLADRGLANKLPGGQYNRTPATGHQLGEGP